MYSLSTGFAQHEVVIHEKVITAFLLLRAGNVFCNCVVYQSITCRNRLNSNAIRTKSVRIRTLCYKLECDPKDQLCVRHLWLLVEGSTRMVKVVLLCVE